MRGWAPILLALLCLSCEYAPCGHAYRSRDQTRLQELRSAIWLWSLDQGRWPTEAEGLDALVRCAPSMNCAQFRVYLARLNKLDSCRRPIQYEVAGSGFRLRALGADGKAGTVDDVVVIEGAAPKP
jgi:general secretion pathway protein G